MGNHLPTFLLKYGGEFHDVTTDVSQAHPFTITAGAAEVSDSLKASKVELTFRDPDGVYRVHDASSPLYGLAGRNTPLYVIDDVLTEMFESGSLGISVSAGASVNGWARSTTSPHSGTWCFKSGTTAHGAFSDAIITVPAGANMCVFWYRTDSETGFDFLEVYSRGTLRFTASGTGGAWTQVAVPCPPTSLGVRELHLRYQKDASATGGADAVYVDDMRFVYSRAAVEVSSWRPNRELHYRPGGGGQTCPITAEGLLRRMGSWTEPLQSAMTRAILGRSGKTGAWTGEDGRAAAAMSNLVASGRPAVASNVDFGDDESPGGGQTSMRLSTTSVVNGTFSRSGTAGWQISWAFKLPAMPSSGTSYPIISWNTSNGYAWSVSVNSGSYTINVTDKDGVVVLTSAIGHGAGAGPNQWMTMRFRASVSGGTVSYNLGWYPEGGGFSYSAGSTFSGDIGYLQRWRVAGNPWLDGAWMGYIYGLNNATTDLLDSVVINGFNGFSGERAGDRFLRLMGEEGLAGTLFGAAADTEPMGPQRPDKLYELLMECRDTDGGLMYDSPAEVGVTMRTRQSMYSQDPALELTYGVNVAPPLVPELDDLGTANEVTATQRDGGSFTVSDTTSPMSILPPPAGAGLYKKEVDVNVSDEDRLEQLAAWWKGQGTVPGARYPSVTVNLDANPELEATATRVLPGDRLTIAGLDADVIDLLVLSSNDKQPNQKRRTFSFACLPYRQYDVGVYDSTTKRYDSRATTLNAGYSSSATALTLRYDTVNDGWSTTSEPYDLEVAGERMTVTSMAAPTGSGPYFQVATVTRSVNGVVKAQAAGEPVHIHPAQVARYAL